MDELVKCDDCGEREAEFKSLGGVEFCHRCAHGIGLSHKHPDIEDTTHCLDGFASKEEIEAHISLYSAKPKVK